ncbi:MAG: aldehyde reductase, partial [Actinomycetota bacterium]
MRATVRSLESEPQLREAVRRGGGDDAALDLVVASLTDDAGWDAAASGVSGVHHLASPMTHATEDRDLVVTPA